MPIQDYAKRQNRKASHTYYKFLLIICILLSLAGLAYLLNDLIHAYQNKTLIPTTEVQKAAPKPAEKKAPKAEEKPEPSLPPKPTFDFYTLLPKMTMGSVIENSPTASLNAKAIATRRPEYFVLQIASLQNASAAEALIARLNALGVEATVQNVQQNGASWMRINSKPYSSFNAAQQAQDRLHEHQIESLLVKTQGAP